MKMMSLIKMLLIKRVMVVARKPLSKLFFLMFTSGLSLVNSVAFSSPNDTRFSAQWYLEQPNDVDMDYDTARAMTAGSQKSEVVVAVIDSAMDTSHPDLVEKLWQNPNEIADGIDNDGDGLVDDINGWDFRNNDNSVFDQIMPHATAVAGIIAATTDNQRSISGVAGDFPVRIMPLQIMNFDDMWKRSCQFNFSIPTFSENIQLAYAFMNAFNYAIDHGADVINASLGFRLPENLNEIQQSKVNRLLSEFEAALARAEQKGILVVIAAGNSNNHYYFDMANHDHVLMDFIGPVAKTYPAMSNGRPVEKCKVVTDGNGDDKYRLFTGVQPELPAMFAAKFKNIIPVASIDENGRLASWLVGEYLRGQPRKRNDHSAYGDIVMLTAPGTNIQSTWPLFDQNIILLLSGNNNGTSFAAPMVTGAVAMLMSLHPELKASDTSRNASEHIEILRDILIHGVRKTDELSYNSDIRTPLVSSGGYLHLPTLLDYANARLSVP